MAENIERIFQDDIRDKRKAGSGAFHMRGKGVRHGFNGALRTPSFFMKTKEKKKLTERLRLTICTRQFTFKLDRI